jgi:hypothetical protein
MSDNQVCILYWNKYSYYGNHDMNIKVFKTKEEAEKYIMDKNLSFFKSNIVCKKIKEQTKQ